MNLHKQVCKGPFVLLIAAFVLVIVAVAFVGDHNVSTRTIGLSDRSRAVIGANARLLSALRDAEAGQRGYLLTGLHDYVRPFGKSQQDVLEALLRLDDLTGDNPIQHAPIDQLSLLISEKLDGMRLILEVYEVRGLAPSLALVEMDRGRVLMERIKNLSMGVDARESTRLNELQSTLYSRLSRTRATVGVGGMILFLFVLLAHTIIRDEMRQQQKLTATLHVSQTELREKLAEIESRKEVLRTSEEHLRLAFETTRMRSWCWTPGHNTIHWFDGEDHTVVPGLVRHSSWPRMLVQVHSDDREPVRQAISEAIRARSEFEVECRTRGDRKLCRWISAKGRYFPARENHPEQIIGVLRDITDQRRAQEVLRETEIQLHQSQKMDAVGRLAGGVAHDFNNILTVISGYTELILLDSSLKVKSRELLSEVQKASGRATRLTNQLLCFSRKELVQPSWLDLNVVVAGMFDMLQRLVSDNIVIHVNISPQPAPVRADRGQLEQVIMNLVVNGRDAMPDGGSLTISTYTVRSPNPLPASNAGIEAGNYSVLTVTDTGTGMTQEVQAKIFEPFFTTKERGHGTGLGLSTVFGILEQNRGKVVVHTEIGKGSRFEIYLPLVKELAGDAITVESANPPGAGNETILVVEDEPAVREFVSQVLRRYGYNVLEASDGSQGLEKGRLHSRIIDLVLTDVMMPLMGGPQMVAQLTEVRSDVAVMYMSGYSDSELSTDATIDRSLRLLQKPFTSDALVKSVRNALDARHVVPPVLVTSSSVDFS